jgi:putative hydrolase of the HAD superfamily
VTAIDIETPRPYDAIILDYNGVIGQMPTKEDWARLAQLCGWPAERVSAFQKAFWANRDAYDEGRITTGQFWSPLLRAAGRRGSALLLSELEAADMAMWSVPDDGVLVLLRRLQQEQGVPMVLLSNAPAPLAEVLDRTAWRAELMQQSVYSAHIGCNKPAPRAYQAALVAAGSPHPGRTLFVDDREANCAAAAALGMATHHFRGDLAALAAALRLQRRPLRPSDVALTW